MYRNIRMYRNIGFGYFSEARGNFCRIFGFGTSFSVTLINYCYALLKIQKIIIVIRLRLFSFFVVLFYKCGLAFKHIVPSKNGCSVGKVLHKSFVSLLSSEISERLFNTAGSMFQAKRSRLLLEYGEQFGFLNYNLPSFIEFCMVRLPVRWP